jgi:hyperosmotically inducible protein
MTSCEKRRIRHVLPIALAGVFALGLGACDQKPSTETAGKGIYGARENDAAGAISDTSGTAGKGLEDTALSTKVKSALNADPALKALVIDVDVSGGAVTLYGTTNTPAHRDKAAQVALNVEGVTSVTNHLFLLKGS